MSGMISCLSSLAIHFPSHYLYVCLCACSLLPELFHLGKCQTKTKKQCIHSNKYTDVLVFKYLIYLCVITSSSVSYYVLQQQCMQQHLHFTELEIITNALQKCSKKFLKFRCGFSCKFSNRRVNFLHLALAYCTDKLHVYLK